MNSHDSLLTDKAASSKLSKFEGEGFSSYTASFFYKQCLKRLRVLFLLVSNYKLNTRVAVRHAKLTSQPSLYFTWNVKRQTDVCDAKSLLWYVQQPEVELVVIQAEWQQAGIYTRKPIRIPGHWASNWKRAYIAVANFAPIFIQSEPKENLNQLTISQLSAQLPSLLIKGCAQLFKRQTFASVKNTAADHWNDQENTMWNDLWKVLSTGALQYNNSRTNYNFSCKH